MVSACLVATLAIKFVLSIKQYLLFYFYGFYRNPIGLVKTILYQKIERYIQLFSSPGAKTKDVGGSPCVGHCSLSLHPRESCR